jgi:hypothetical protein
LAHSKLLNSIKSVVMSIVDGCITYDTSTKHYSARDDCDGTIGRQIHGTSDDQRIGQVLLLAVY